MTKTFDARRNEFAPYGFSCEVWRPARMPRPDRHNEIELNLLTGGRLTYMMRGETVHMEGETLSVFWAASPHQIIDFQGSDPYYVATAPLAWFLQWNLSPSFVQAVLNGGFIMEAGKSKADEALFKQWVDDLKRGGEEIHTIVRLEMEARIRRLSLGVSARREKPSPELKGGAGKIEAMAAYIAEHYTTPLDLAEIGKAVGLHPNYAAGLFSKTFGATLNATITEYRISHAQRLLLTTDSTVLDIAFAAGFNSLSRFNAAFKQACGCPPRQYRRRHREEDRLSPGSR